MKHFKIILTVTKIAVILLFAANVIFMVRLYGSIKARYMDDVEQCLRRADHIELVGRIVGAGLGNEDDVVFIQLGLQKSDVGTATKIEELAESGYSQGYKRMDRQIVDVITRYLHDAYDDILGTPDFDVMEEAFRRDLEFSGYYPDEVHIIGPGMALDGGDRLWHIKSRTSGKPLYEVYISPLTENILAEMSGVLISSALLALVLTLGFCYLLHVINHLRTIEEMKDDFTSNMTHELKTPIAIAYAANDSLLQFPDPKDEARTEKYLTAALEQLSKLSGLVERILAMSMERRRCLAMSKVRIQLKPFLSVIVEQQKLKSVKDCSIRLDCPDSASVNADPTHFSNVIANLIDNSIKYSGDSVLITIRADNESVSVTDNGIGIPEKSRPYVFNKFYRVPHGNRRDAGGYGIGLFYVRSIVDKHGWNITVDSRPGVGSTFTIIF